MQIIGKNYSITDIVDACNVSRGTANNAVNNPWKLSVETLEYIYSTMGYSMDVIALIVLSTNRMYSWFDYEGLTEMIKKELSNEERKSFEERYEED